MKRFWMFLCFCLFFNYSPAGIFSDASIGAAAGYSSYQTFRGEIYFRSGIKLLKCNAELKFGFNNHAYDLDFDGVKNLHATSVGVFGDIAIYPFKKILFTGVRWELINANWLSPASKNKIKGTKYYNINTLYTGTSIYFQLGCRFKASEKVSFRIFGQPGFQQYKISNGSSSSGSYSQSSSTDKIISEDHFEFIYNVNLGVDFKF